MSLLKKTRSPLGTRARTGERCPESGNWRAIGFSGSSAPIAEGNVMPPYKGNAVTWELYAYA